MRRREFITLLGGTAVWPLAARAQQSDRVRRIGVLDAGARSDPEAQGQVSAFEGTLRTLGWTDGRNARIDWRWADGEFDRMQASAKELVALQAEVILAFGGAPVLRALLQETRRIPIVFTGVSDPVGQGFVESLARPGGNATGFTLYESSLGKKWIELLTRIAPRVRRIALVFNPQTSSAALYLPSIEAAAMSFAVQLVKTPIRDSAELEGAITALGREPGNGLMFVPDNFINAHRELITGLANRYGLPAVYPGRFQTSDGGLLSYGVDLLDMSRRAAGYVDRILKGANAADLPVQQPTKFELVINLKTAKALGLTVPDTLLALADEVIE
jgi:putative ABC transport system substrate-binding protein